MDLIEVATFIEKAGPILTFMSAIIIVLYNQNSIHRLEKEKRNFDVNKLNRDFILGIRERRIKQIEEYLYEISEACYENFYYIMLTRLQKDQNELDALIYKYWNEEDDNSNESHITYHSIINSLDDSELSSILVELDNELDNISDLCNKYLSNGIRYEFISKNHYQIINEVQEVRNRYRNALTKFYARLDKLYEGWGIYNQTKNRTSKIDSAFLIFLKNSIKLVKNK